MHIKNLKLGYYNIPNIPPGKLEYIQKHIYLYIHDVLYYSNFNAW